MVTLILILSYIGVVNTTLACLVIYLDTVSLFDPIVVASMLIADVATILRLKGASYG